ncbi:hypothetical protein B0T10DRAFT_568302 [Thelonectria olida]|uniref:LysM domain-containing protein n=1 Tax=Thelonectria olida TaxID=1576542 RepID=A0A9P8VRK1_9HYPO|nr:hypothetical protein B0T10DRAFT_568302 [Thelonectria olida]
MANGSLQGCGSYFNNDFGDLPCIVVANAFSVNVEQWVLWNPSVLKGGSYSADNCTAKNGTQYCAVFYDLSSIPNASTNASYLPVPTDATANATHQCYDCYYVYTGDTCE